MSDIAIDRIIVSLGSNYLQQFTISSGIDINSFKWQERVDYAFGEGEVDIITNKLSYNIPPYSIAEVWLYDHYDSVNQTDHYMTTYYLIQSTATKHPQIDGLYVHHCKLTDPTALLETMIVGTKTFSNQSTVGNDGNKAKLLMLLMNAKYDVHLSMSNTVSNLTGNNEYSFGAGTTFYAALVEIGMRNNYRPVITSLQFSGGTNRYWYTIGWTHNVTSSYDISNYRVIDVSYNQEQGNYCKYLETEAKNVVDRNSMQTWNNLSVRGDGPAINADHAVVQLPTNVEAITEFSVNLLDGASNYYYPVISLDLSNYSDIITNEFLSNKGISTQTEYSWSTWVSVFSGTDVADVLDELANHYSWYDFTIYRHGSFQIRLSPNIVLSNSGLNIQVSPANMGSVPVTQRLVEENYWNTLPANQKSTYAVYKSGGNTIYNLNAKYKYDLIGTILGQAQSNFLDQTFNYSYTNTSNDIETNIAFTLTMPSNPLKYTYNVEGVAIIKPKLIIGKTSTALNEPAWKDMTRTYTNTANTIDMDSLITDMQGKVNPLGNIEMTITLDTSDTVIAGQYPRPKNVITYNSNAYYIISCESTMRRGFRTTEYFCCRSPQKIADAIGVDYQFNPIRLPYYATVDRPIYLEYDDTSDGSLTYAMLQSINAGYPVIVLLECKISSIIARAGFRCVAVSDDDYNHYLYFEALDNYSAGTQAIYVSSGVYENRDIRYGDSNLEFVYGNFVIYCFAEQMDKDTADLMPNINRTTFNGFSMNDSRELFNDVVIYKDGRERLTFTIKIKRN